MITMPNWCYNFLTIIGDKKELKKFRKKLFSVPKPEFVCSGSVVEKLREDYIKENEHKLLNDLNYYIEIQLMDIKEFVKNKMYYDFDKKGNVVKKCDNGFLNKFYPMPCELKGTTSPCQPNEELIEKYGYDNWYNWRVNKWGTKWDVDIQFREEDSGDEVLYISFDSAWSPPCNWLLKVSKDFPNLKFVLEYEESGCCFKGVTTCYAKEELFDDECWEWRGDCGECETDYDEEGRCGCVGENGKPLKWGEEEEEEEEEEV